MTQIDFHTGLADPLRQLCRLVQKIYLLGHATAITGEERWLAAVNDELWSFEAASFVPHALMDSPPALTQNPVATLPSQSPPSGRIAPPLPLPSVGLWHLCPRNGTESVLIHRSNSAAPPENFARFERLIELVGNDEAEILAARQRWKYYKARGYPLKLHAPKVKA